MSGRDATPSDGGPSVRRLAYLGGVCLLAGFVAFAGGDVADSFDFDYTAVTVVGLLAAVQALRFGVAARRRDRKTVDVGDPEERHRVPVPGDDLDERLARLAGRSRHAASRRRRVRERLREAAAESLVAAEDLPRDAARRRVETGDWTDDDVAAGFLAAEAGVPVAARVRALFARESSFGYAVGRTVAAIEEVDR